MSRRSSYWPVLITFSLLASFTAYYFKNVLYAKEELKSPEQIKEESLLRSFSSKVVDRICSNDTGACFILIDRIEKRGGRLLAFRGLLVKGTSLFISDARLLIPKSLNLSNINTSEWIIDKKTVRMDYARMMIAGLFFSTAVDFRATKKQHVLVIGMGAGVISSYLTTIPDLALDVTTVDNDPVMDRIAKKWFNLKESPLHHVIIQDGVQFAKIAARRKQKFDGILVDVSHNRLGPLICPPSEFLENDVIRSFARILSDRGVLIVNVITLRQFFHEGNTIKSLFEKHFKTCLLLPYASQNRMLFCFRRKNPWKNSDHLRAHVAVIDQELGFNLIPGDYVASDIE